jgi:hypothetical protein
MALPPQQHQDLLHSTAHWVGQGLDNCINLLGGWLDKLTAAAREMQPSSPLITGGMIPKLNPANMFRQDTSPDPTPAVTKVGRSAEVMRGLEMPTPAKEPLNLSPDVGHALSNFRGVPALSMEPVSFEVGLPSPSATPGMGRAIGGFALAH